MADVCKNVEIWKIKQYLRVLEPIRSKDENLISVMIPAGGELSGVLEISRDASVSAASNDSLPCLLEYTASKLPPNGLVFYHGMDDEGCRRGIAFEPFKPMNRSLYFRGNMLKTEPVKEFLERNDTYGFIVSDEKKVYLFGLCGNELQYYCGGFRPPRSSREEYARATAILARRVFVDSKYPFMPKIVGLTLAGTSGFPSDLRKGYELRFFVKVPILNVIESMYGGEIGFKNAIDMSEQVQGLSDVKYFQEKRLILKLFKEIRDDTGRFAFGLKNTLKALEIGVVEDLIVWEQLGIIRCCLRDVSGEMVVRHLNNEEQVEQAVRSGFEVKDRRSLLMWFAQNHKTFGCRVEFVTKESREGSQLCKAFDGIAAILRVPVKFDEGEEEHDEEEGSDVDSDDAEGS